MYALHLTNDAEESKDIVSDVFERLWRNFSSINESTLPSYLTTSVRNKCIDYLRHNIVASNFLTAYLKETELFYSNYSEEIAKDRLVQRMLEELPPLTRHILEECYLRRNKYSEVAEKMNISPNTVKKHISKALKLLREKFNGENRLIEIPDNDIDPYNK